MLKAPQGSAHAETRVATPPRSVGLLHAAVVRSGPRHEHVDTHHPSLILIENGEQGDGPATVRFHRFHSSTMKNGTTVPGSVSCSIRKA
jgi:hypothetical protein